MPQYQGIEKNENVTKRNIFQLYSFQRGLNNIL